MSGIFEAVAWPLIHGHKIVLYLKPHSLPDTMKNSLLIALSLAAISFGLSNASAQTYKWKDANGHTVISDTPPPLSTKLQKTQTVMPESTPTAPNASTTPKSVAEKEMDFKKRQQDVGDKADKARKEQEAAAEKKKNCESAQQAVNTLQSSRPVTTTNSKGERVAMDNSARQQELERARKIAEEACK